MKIPFALLILVHVGASQLLGSEVGALGKPAEKYLAFWLTLDPSAKDPTEYEPLLLLTRLPLKELPAHYDLRELRDRVLKPGTDEPLLESLALTIETYRKDSIWNADR